MTPEIEGYCRERAYVPEQIVSLMTAISRGEAFLCDDCLALRKDRWAIVVGYPFSRAFSQEACERLVAQVVADCRPEVLWFIGPELPPSLQEGATERQSDHYYLLEIDKPPRPALLKAAERAGRLLSVSRGQVFSGEHEQLAETFLQDAGATPRVEALYRSMPGYLGRSATAWTLDARDSRGRLCAFFVVETDAVAFSTYLIGARLRGCEIPHVSDLLFREMIRFSQELGKRQIHLGLGVNGGIRRFKEKWGGRPAWPYVFCEYRYGRPWKASLLDLFLGPRG